MTQTAINLPSALASGNDRAPLKDRKDDLYETHPVATHALIKHVKLPHTIWECACGPGAIASVLEGVGHSVIATDLVDYGYRDALPGIDFLMARPQWLGRQVEAIVTNPPFKLAEEFVERACELVPLVVMLLRLEFVAGERHGLLDRFRPSQVLVFKNRLPRMHRAGWTGKKASSRVSFAWFVWDRAHSGPTELKRISWQPIGGADVGR